MTKWLRSGRRRDLCFLLAAEGERRGQELKSSLESHYGERIEPKAFYGSLAALVAAGHVEKGTAGLHDVYALTESGERRVREHAGWVRECVGD